VNVEARLTQRAIAQQLKVSQQTIARIITMDQYADAWPEALANAGEAAAALLFANQGVAKR